MSDGASELTELKDKRLSRMTAVERDAYERVSAEERLAAEVGERVCRAREDAGLSQRDLAAWMGTSEAAIARLEAGGVGATLTTLRRVALALGLELNVELRPSTSMHERQVPAAGGASTSCSRQGIVL